MNYKDRFAIQHRNLNEMQTELKFKAHLRDLEMQRMMKMGIHIPNATAGGNEDDDTINNYVVDDYIEDYFL